MRKVVLGIVAILLIGVVYGETNYTYEKKGENVLKIVEVETTQRISATDITIKGLKNRIKNLKEQKADALEFYNETIVKLDEQIAFIQAQIDKAKELGVKE